MRFEETSLKGVFTIAPEPHSDDRGTFLRAFCTEEFARQGVPMQVAQTSLSTTRVRGTLRGMHLQRAPYGEQKVVRCVRGAAYDVALDLRPGSPTFGTWEAFELTEGGRAVYLPVGVAHGFQALTDDSVLLYHISTPYSADHAAGVRYDDPDFGIRWPIDHPILSDRDRSFGRWERDA